MQINRDATKCYLKKFNLTSKQNIFRQSYKEIKNPNITQATPYSIKPLNCSIPRDINLHDIFYNMLNISHKISRNLAYYIELSLEEKIARTEIFQAINNFLTVNNAYHQSKIMCNVMYFFDILMNKNKDKKLLDSPYQIAMGAVLLSIKFYNGKNCLSKNIINFTNMFKQQSFTKSQINIIEINCLKLIDYYLHFPSPTLFMELFFINGIIFRTDNIKNEEGFKIYNWTIKILEKIIFSSNIYLKYNPLYLCCCVTSYARELFNLEKWPQILSKVFEVNFYSFEIIYNEFYKLIIKNNISDNESKEKNYKNKQANKDSGNEVGKNTDVVKLCPFKSVFENLVVSSNKCFSPIKPPGDNQKASFIYFHNKNNYHRKVTTENYDDDVDNNSNKNKQKIINKTITIEIETQKKVRNTSNINNYRCFYKNDKNDNSYIAKKLVDYSNDVTSDNSKNLMSIINYNKKNYINKKKKEKKNNIIFGDFNYDDDYNLETNIKHCNRNNNQPKIITIIKPGKTKDNKRNIVSPINVRSINIKKFTK